MRKRLLALVAGLVGCAPVVDVAELPSIEGYNTWYSVEFGGPVPGHGDSVRPVFVNDVARTYPHGGRYAVGSVVVKEVRERNADNSAGALRYIAVMRKVGDTPVSAPVDDGWVFTQLSGPGAAERSPSSCWSTCHRHAPVDGAWYDYGE